MESVLRGHNDDIMFIRKEVEAEAKQRHAININRTTVVKVDFPESDERLKLTPDGPGFSGTFKGRPIVLANVNEDEMKIGRSGSRHVEVYKRISVGALVQSFYGICERNGKKYAVMEDLRNQPTLAVAIKSNLLPNDSPTRIRIAYDLANTIAYLHSVGIIIKSMSDDTVVLRRLDGGKFQPCLTNLETARMVRVPSCNRRIIAARHVTLYPDPGTNCPYRIRHTIRSSRVSEAIYPYQAY
jgi:serine/threonine protein kinase